MNQTAKIAGAVAIAGVALAVAYGLGLRAAAPAAPPAGGPPQAQRAGPPAVPVEVARVMQTALPQGITAVGSLRSDESVVVRPEVSGRIASFSFREGEAVAKGMPLVRLDASVAGAELQQAKANLVLYAAKFDRAVDLFQKGFISGQARDEAENNLKVAQAAVALAEAKLAKTEIVAPFAGVIGLRAASVGDYVKEGQDIVNLEAIDPLKVDFRVPEIYLKQLRVGQSLQITLDAFPDQFFPGRIFAINPLVDSAGRSVVLRATVQNPQGRLRPGSFARVRLIIDAQAQALMIPEQAIVPSGDEQYVFKVSEGKALRTRVETGLRRDGKVEIVRGLSAEDTVVAAGQFKLRDGMPVQAIGAATAPASPASTAAKANPS